MKYDVNNGNKRFVPNIITRNFVLIDVSTVFENRICLLSHYIYRKID